jgi:hypothetical protein
LNVWRWTNEPFAVGFLGFTFWNWAAERAAPGRQASVSADPSTGITGSGLRCVAPGTSGADNADSARVYAVSANVKLRSGLHKIRQL